MIAALILIELFPGDRGRHRRAFSSPRRIRHDGCRAALVAELVEEDAALALDLADVGGEHLRFGLGDGAAEAIGKTLHRRPVLRRTRRPDDGPALTPRQQ